MSGVLLAKGLAAAGLTGADLAGMAKGAMEKQVLAWWLRKHTVAPRRWITGQLHMGDESRVTQAVAAIQRSKERKTLMLRKKLERLIS